MEQNDSPTPRERLEFTITNKAPLIGSFNGHELKIKRIRLVDIKTAWSEVIDVIKAFQLNVVSKHSLEAGSEDQAYDPASAFYDSLKGLGPDFIGIVHTFIKTSSDATDTMLAEADFVSIVELVVIILEHNVSEELMVFFERGGKVLEELGLKPVPSKDGTAEPDSSPNNSF